MSILNFIPKAHAQAVTISQLPPDVTLETLFLRIVSWALYIGGAAAAIYVIYGGFSYITSAGDQQKAEQAKNTLTYAIIGLVVIALAISIVTWVNNWLQGNII